MASKKKAKDIDVTKSGPATWRDLQEANSLSTYGLSGDDGMQGLYDGLGLSSGEISLYDPVAHAQRDISSPMQQGTTHLGDKDYWGRSIWDENNATEEQFGNLGDIRAENQPWYSKVASGIGKAGVLAVTTALETGGLIYGIGQGISDAVNAEDGKGGRAFLHGLWYNPITEALQKINDVSEEYMPNYYTQDEMENPWSNTFTANFLGDKLIKNFGFMVGAFYGGMPFASGIGKAGQKMVTRSRNFLDAEMMGMQSRADALVARAAKTGENAEELLKTAHLTQAERAAKMKDGLSKIDNIARKTKNITQAVGVVGAAINEGAIEAINNSRDWADMRTQEENNRFQQEIAGLESDPMLDENALIAAKMEASEEHQRKLAAIEEGRAEVGNADLLMNLPILLASNAIQLARLYTRGFESTRRQMGSFWNDYKLPGELAKHNLATDKTKLKGLASALYKTNTEGVEELTQKMAADASGYAVDNAIERHMSLGKGEEATTSTNDYLKGMGKSIAENLQSPEAWQEYFIGALSAAVGMPVFGSQTKNAYAKLGPVGLQGGVFGNYRDYTGQMQKEQDIADYLNKRVQQPEFKAMYDRLRKSYDIDKLIEESILNHDKKEFKDMEFNALFNDINAAASSGHLAEFRELINFDDDYTDEDLDNLVKVTSKTLSAEDQRQADRNRQQYYKDRMEQVSPIDSEEVSRINQQLNDQTQKEADLQARLVTEGLSEEEQDELDDEIGTVGAVIEDLEEQRDKILSRTPDEDLFKVYKDEYDGATKRLAENAYKDGKLEGPFIDANGEMSATEAAREEMKRILERNKKRINTLIDDYLKFRNDTDIETDGRLDDDQISELTWMKAKIHDYDRRSAEMADELLKGLPEIGVLHEQLKTKVDKAVEQAETGYKDAVAKQKEVDADKKATAKAKEKAAAEVQSAKDSLALFKQMAQDSSNALGLIDFLTQEIDTTRNERRALDKGYGKDEEGKTYSDRYDNSTRAINATEMQNLLTDDRNYRSLKSIVKSAGLDPKATERMVENVRDLHRLAQEKKAYSKKLREFIGNPDLLNEVAKTATEKMSKEQRDNKISELALNIGKVRDMTELDTVMRDVTMDPELMREAAKKAREDGDENFRKFLDDYQSGTEYMSALSEQLDSLSLDMQQSLSETLDEAWNLAVAKGLNTKSEIHDYMEEAAKAFKKAGRKELADTLSGILKDLGSVERGTNTNKKVKEPSKETKDADEDDVAFFKKGKNGDKAKNGGSKAKPFIDRMDAATSLDELDKAMNDAIVAGVNEKEVKPAYDKKAKELAEASGPDTPETIRQAIADEIRSALTGKSKSFVATVDGLPGTLQARIGKYNSENPDSVVDDSVVAGILQQVNDELENEENGKAEKAADKDIDTEEFELTRQEEMIASLASSFKSDGQASEFAYYDESGSVLLSYTKPYKPRNAREEAIQKVLSDYKAYQFVNKNYLGYVATAQGYPKVHLLRATFDKELRNSDHPATFLAIEVTDDVKKAIRQNAFGGRNVDLEKTGEIRPVTINGKQYQIVGILSINTKESGIAPEVSDAFFSLQGAITTGKALGQKMEKDGQEVDMPMYEAVNRIKNTDSEKQPFLISEHTVDIQEIYTGRLEKFNDSNDNGMDKVSLHTFMTSTQGKEKRTSTEWKSDMPVHFGVVINGGVVDTVTGKDGTVAPIGSAWINKNNGQILLYVPKPDGRLYPVRCTRRYVKDWWGSNDVDGVHTGEQLLNAVLDGTDPTSNEFLENIITHLDTLLSEETSFADKIAAKNLLGKYFLFGGPNPFNVNEVSGTVTMYNQEVSFDPGDDLATNVMKVFEALASHDARFSLPSPTIESVEGRDVVNAGVFEIGLRGYYNFNANFTIKPVTGKGDDVVVRNIPEGTGHFARVPHKNGSIRTIDFGNGERTFYRDDQGNVFNEDGTAASEEDVNFLNAYDSITSTTPDSIDTLLEMMEYKEDMVKAFRKYARENKQSKAAKFAKKYGKVYVRKLGNDTWVIIKGDGRADIFKLGTLKANKFFAVGSLGGKRNGENTDGTFQAEARAAWAEFYAEQKKKGKEILKEGSTEGKEEGTPLSEALRNKGYAKTTLTNVDGVVENADKLNEVLLSKDGHNLFMMDSNARTFVIANINGVVIPFYMSSRGTDGKIKGAWYPFFGMTGNWLVKGDISPDGKMNYSPEIDRVTRLLNDNLHLDSTQAVAMIARDVPGFSAYAFSNRFPKGVKGTDPVVGTKKKNGASNSLGDEKWADAVYVEEITGIDASNVFNGTEEEAKGGWVTGAQHIREILDGIKAQPVSGNTGAGSNKGKGKNAPSKKSAPAQPETPSGSDGTSIFAGVTVDDLEENTYPKNTPLGNLKALADSTIKGKNDLIHQILGMASAGTLGMSDNDINEGLEKILKTENRSERQKAFRELQTAINCGKHA